jgi:hypothetical protein
MCINNFYRRVNYIAQAISSKHTGGKKFLEYFSQDDSEFIITALIQKAVRDEKFDNALREFVGPHYDVWLWVASHYYQLDKQELKDVARTARIIRRLSKRKINQANEQQIKLQHKLEILLLAFCNMLMYNWYRLE